MRTDHFLFTSESVSEGHPDKVCDRISDAIVDTYLRADPVSRVAVETLTTTNQVVLAGEVRGPEEVTHQVLEDVRVLLGRNLDALLQRSNCLLHGRAEPLWPALLLLDRIEGVQP